MQSSEGLCHYVMPLNMDMEAEASCPSCLWDHSEDHPGVAFHWATSSGSCLTEGGQSHLTSQVAEVL
jgi:hypothetical protein